MHVHLVLNRLHGPLQTVYRNMLEQYPEGLVACVPWHLTLMAWPGLWAYRQFERTSSKVQTLVIGNRGAADITLTQQWKFTFGVTFWPKVSDSFDIWRACKDYWGDKLKDLIKGRGLAWPGKQTRLLQLCCDCDMSWPWL